MHRFARPLFSAVAILLLVVAATASAQAPAARTEPVGEIGSLRIRYGVALRSGQQTDIGPGLSYSGMTPNDAAASGAYWLGGGHFGVALSGHREGFALFGTDGAQITGGSLWRASGGPSARIGLGPLMLEAIAGYGFAQLPAFGANSVTPQFGPALRHGPTFGGRVAVALPFDLKLEARGEYPLALFAQDASGAAAQASGFSAGAALIWGLGNFGSVTYGLVADYQYVHDTLTVGSAISATQTLSRAGLALEFSLLDKPPPPPPPRFGGLAISVVDADTGKPLPDAKLTLTSRGRPVSSDKVRPDGAGFFGRELEPGEVVARVVLGGYLPAEGTASIVAGRDGSLEVRAKKEPPKVGALAIVLVDKATAAPIANAVIKLKGQEYVTGPGGNVTVRDLAPGPVAVEVAAASYRPVQEVASIVVFKTATLPLQLVKLQQKLPAVINGVVRSTRGGKPVAATLEIVEANLRHTATSEGTFTFPIGGGTYTVRISAPGFLSQKKSVTVKDGDQAIFNVDLHPDSRK